MEKDTKTPQKGHLFKEFHLMSGMEGHRDLGRAFEFLSGLLELAVTEWKGIYYTL